MNEISVEVKIAMQGVIEASILCEKIQKDLIGEVSFIKSDASPVTIADYASQALICKRIKDAFPKDTIIAEEDSVDLRKNEHSNILARATHYIRNCIPDASPRDVCDWIDSSSHVLGERFWTLDPIDGTKGFLRGDQYAIALALIERGAVTLGVLGCPNLHVHVDQPEGEKGCLFLARRGKGSVQIALDGGERQDLSVCKINDPSESVFTESVEIDHSDHVFHRRVARKLDMDKPAIRMDSLVKYAIVGRGEAVFYLRIPAPYEQDFKENIWDHAAGAIIAEEAGGRVTDAFGRPLDFASAIKMTKNYGIVVTNGILHERILEALHPLPIEKAGKTSTLH